MKIPKKFLFFVFAVALLFFGIRISFAQVTTGAIQGYKVDQNGSVSDSGATITIAAIGSFSGNPYNSGQIAAATYTVSSSQPSGYTVSYSTNPGGGATTYLSGSSVVVSVSAGGTVNLWWKYTPVAAPTTGAGLSGMTNVYSPSVVNSNGIKKMWMGGWLTEGDIGPDKIYQSQFFSSGWSRPAPLNWTNAGYSPGLKPGYHSNDPSVVSDQIRGALLMYYTALSNQAAQPPFQLNQHAVGLAISLDDGGAWTDQGIVMNPTESGDGQGVWSPGAVVVGDEIWVYYHTGTQDFSQPINFRQRFSSDGRTKNGSPERLRFINGTGTVLVSNLDVTRQGTRFIMVANTLDLKSIVRYVSQDGLTWTTETGVSNPLVATTNGFVLTPHLEFLSSDRFQVYYGRDTGGGSHEILSVEFSQPTASVGATSAVTSISPSIPTPLVSVSESAPSTNNQQAIQTLLDQIRVLQMQIDQLQEVQTSAAPPVVSSTDSGLNGNKTEEFSYIFNYNLYYGLMNNSDVRALQNVLSLQRIYTGPITGNFLKLTLRAVKDFQITYGISATGFVGPLTRKKLNEFSSH
ncbi:MAG: peptidoglycan-binding protein [bacterium]|nr:peptidoglycan-binding protein [bacterium]